MNVEVYILHINVLFNRITKITETHVANASLNPSINYSSFSSTVSPTFSFINKSNNTAEQLIPI